MDVHDDGGHLIVGGQNYGQGSSREHGALVPAFLGLRAVIARFFARIHGQNLVNFGLLPLLFCDPADHAVIEPGAVLRIENVHEAVRSLQPFNVRDTTADRNVEVRLELSDRQIELLLAGGLINAFRQRHHSE
jgi:aconitate hydratase